MALLIIVKKIRMYLQFIKFFRLNMHVESRMKIFASRVIDSRKSALRYSLSTYQGSHLYWKQSDITFHKQYSTSLQPQHTCNEDSAKVTLLTKLENALRESKDEAAWSIFKEFKSSYGFPDPSLVRKLITVLSYSSDQGSLQKACELVFKLSKERPELLQHDMLSRLSLSLARAQMFVPASKVIRLMLQKNIVPTMDVLSSVFLHMVKTEAGTNLASNILLEICDCYQCLSAKRSECAMSMKPSTTIFNLILNACVRYKSSLKGQQIIELMAQTGVVADAYSVALFADIYEMNGQRDELKKFKEYVDQVSIPLASHYSQFYDKLLSLHYEFDDLDAAATLVSDMYFHWGSRPLTENKDLKNPCPVPIGSPYLKEGLKVKVMFELLQKDSIFRMKGREDFVKVESGKLVLTCRGWAPLIVKYQKCGKIAELSKLLDATEKEKDTSEQGSLCYDVIHACVYTGWLETAHDIVDDMEMANTPVPTGTYMLLLNAYCREKMFKEAEALAKQIKRVGLLIDANDERIISECLSAVANTSTLSILPPVTSRQSELTDCVVLETRREDKDLSKVLEINSSIYFFCKAKMVEDARKAYRQLQVLNVQPTVQTFAYLIQGYSSLEMYREITILWGDMKRYMNHGCSLANRDLYELLLLNFLRGGYFERVMEVIGLMKEHGMCADRWKYRNEFVRIHKSLYRRLKAEDAQNEAQRLRFEHVSAFRKWVRNN